MKTGDVVRVRRIRSNDEWCVADVALCSKNMKSAALDLGDGFVWAAAGIIAGVLPLSIDLERETVKGLDGQEYEIEVKEKPDANRTERN